VRNETKKKETAQWSSKSLFHDDGKINTTAEKEEEEEGGLIYS